MKNKYFNIILIGFVFSVFFMMVTCNNKEATSEKNDMHKTVTFPKYSNVFEMLEAAHDFENECLEILSKEGETMHVKVSSEHLNNEVNKELNEQVKRDIIYVVFQAFAQTNIEEISVTAIPITRSTFNPNKKYDGKLKESLKQTVTVNRKRAKEILNKRFETATFSDLYHLKGMVYVPSPKFEKLMYSKFRTVFRDLKK